MPLSNKPILIAITGGIASGKSTFCQLLREHGYQVHSADTIAHNQYSKLSVQQSLVDMFGEQILVNGVLSREVIGDIVFKDKEKRLALNELLHPLILHDMQNIYDKSTEQYCFFEVPLLFEAKLEQCFDCNVLVYSERRIQVGRLVQNRNISKEKALAIIDSQFKIEDKKRLSDYIILNNNTIDALKTSLADFQTYLPSIIAKSKIKLTESYSS